MEDASDNGLHIEFTVFARATVRYGKGPKAGVAAPPPSAATAKPAPADTDGAEELTPHNCMENVAKKDPPASPAASEDAEWQRPGSLGSSKVRITPRRPLRIRNDVVKALFPSAPVGGLHRKELQVEIRNENRFIADCIGRIREYKRKTPNGDLQREVFLNLPVTIRRQLKGCSYRFVADPKARRLKLLTWKDESTLPPSDGDGCGSDDQVSTAAPREAIKKGKGQAKAAAAATEATAGKAATAAASKEDAMAMAGKGAVEVKAEAKGAVKAPGGKAKAAAGKGAAEATEGKEAAEGTGGKRAAKATGRKAEKSPRRRRRVQLTQAGAKRTETSGR